MLSAKDILDSVRVNPGESFRLALLKRAEHPMHALAAYEAERLPPTAQIVRMNRKGGPEAVIDAVETLAPDGFTNIDDVLPYPQRMAIARGYASATGVNRAKG